MKNLHYTLFSEAQESLLKRRGHKKIVRSGCCGVQLQISVFWTGQGHCTHEPTETVHAQICTESRQSESQHRWEGGVIHPYPLLVVGVSWLLERESFLQECHP